MVLESLIGPIKAEKKPWKLFYIGFLYSIIGFVTALWIFEQSASIVFVFLIVICCIPLVYKIIKIEEEKDLKMKNEMSILKEHSKALVAFMFLFFGITVAVAFCYAFAPSDTMGSLFSSQVKTIASINGKFTHVTSHVSSMDAFIGILYNNINVLLYCLGFAFIFGSGAMFILVWNASVIGTAIGSIIRTKIAGAAAAAGSPSVALYFSSISLGLARYAIHGIPEIVAYFVGALAGGIISIAAINHNFKTKQFYRIIFDSSGLILIAIFTLVLAAFLEVYITPRFFS